METYIVKNLEIIKRTEDSDYHFNIYKNTFNKLAERQRINKSAIYFKDFISAYFELVQRAKNTIARELERDKLFMFKLTSYDSVVAKSVLDLESTIKSIYPEFYV